jgi:hypothetical protein
MENQDAVQGAVDFQLIAHDLAALSAAEGILKSAFLLHDGVRHAEHHGT